MEVNVTKCLNGHYYDANKYESCPHCGAVSCVEKTPNEAEKSARKGAFGFFQRKKKASSVELISLDSKDDADGTVGLFSESKEKKAKTAPLPVEIDPVDEAGTTDDVVDDEMTYGRFVEARTEKKEKSEGVSLFHEVRNVTGNNDSKTMGFFRMGSSSDNSDETEEIEPVCGWLVCIKGKHFGRAYNVFAGSNSIGRNDTNRIVVNSEDSLSREKHAWVIYEPRKREFFLKPGESSGLTYHNDENILEAVKIKTGDKIELGEVAFVFVALCGTDFSWEDYVVEG